LWCLRSLICMKEARSIEASQAWMRKKNKMLLLMMIIIIIKMLFKQWTRVNITHM
jgi:hypothetical protein